MKKNVDKYIPLAIAAIPDSEFLKDNKIASKYHGYISSFGTMVLHAGPLAATLLYSEEGKDKKVVTDTIWKLLESEMKYKENQHENMLSCILDLNKANKKNELNKLRKEMLNAAIAIKLVLRTYEKTDND